MAIAAVVNPSGGGTATAAEPAQLGRAPEHAAVSCWDIKQKHPAATDGSYWLLTPLLKAPQQFHCDMTTDGGGWVLVGRGREGWNFAYNGQGTAEQVRTTVNGTAAFVPRALPSTVIDGLLNGARVDQLADGVRFRRAANVAGTSAVEGRLRFSNRDRWAWTMDANHPLAGYSFGSQNYTGGNTRSFGVDTQYRRVQTTETEAQGWRKGWAYGTAVAGSTSATTHLWSATGNSPMPFTQVYLRPRLTSENTPFAAIGDTGAPASARQPLLANEALPAPWGVTGRANGRTGELDTEVQAFAQSGSRMIVGGNFQFVQAGADGANRVQQSYLAAFDVKTGEWLPDFRPTVDGQVKALHTLANGTVVAGGEFSTANGAPSVGMVALDPTTGATDPSFTASVENRVTGATVSVRSFDAHGPWLYLGGRFTHVDGGTRASPAYARNAARVSLVDGTPDGQWNPLLDGGVADLDVSSAGDRVYLAGNFTTTNGVDSPRVAVVTTAAGAAPIPNLGKATLNHRTNYQQAIEEVGGRVWVGGAQHALFSYGRSNFAQLSANVTHYGGDFQTINSQNGVVYAGCHCNDFNYSGVNTYVSGWPTTFAQGDNIGHVGAWDAATGAYLPEFHPLLKGQRGQGPWAMETDSTGAMWIGGDFDQAQMAGGTTRWVGGFARYAERDSRAPTTPSGPGGSNSAGTTTLTWAASTDDRGAVVYEILRGDRVFATVPTTRTSFPAADPSARYFVRAVDGAGNRSATTAVFTVPAPK